MTAHANYTQFARSRTLQVSQIDMAALAIEILGEPKHRSGNEWRWGDKLGISVNIAKACFNDRGPDVSGGVLDFVRHFQRLPDRKSAAQWLADRGYIDPLDPDYVAPPRKPPEPPKFKPIGHHTTDTQPLAMKLWGESWGNLSGIIAHPYSVAKKLPPHNYGAKYTEHRGEPCIVVPQYSLPGWEVCGVQLITGRRTDAGGWEKLNRGPRGIGCVGKMAPGSPIVVVEGWADAAALWEQSPVQHPGIVIAFGKVLPVASNLDLYFKGTRKITALEDND